MSLTATETATRTLLPAISDDEIYTIDQLIKRRAAELKDLTLIGYPKEGLTDYEEHSARAVDRYVDAAVQALQEKGIKPADANIQQAPVMGILAQSGLHVLMTILGLSRLGYAVLLLSTRLASPAIVRLLDLAHCDVLLTTPNFHDILAEVQRERRLELIELLVHADYYRLDAPKYERNYDVWKETKKNAIIIHSSGSTGLPKPIYLTHRSCIGAFATNLDMRALVTTPLFHSQAFYETFRTIYSGKPLYYCNYTLPLTKQNLIAMVDQVKPEIFHCVPYVLKLLAESQEGIECLARVKLVLFAGSACPDDLGDRLVRAGVNLVGNYGSTEVGRLMNSVRPPGDHDWNYMRMLPIAKPYVLMDEIAPRIYECVALEGLRSKSTVNSDNPPGSFRTRDLFTPHPTRPGLWKYVSRLDDRFTLVNGEKVLPIPIEGRIRQEELVQEAIIFGEGRSVPGVLIVKSDRASQISDEEFVNHVWPAVQDANSRAETFSRIPKELVVVLTPDTVYARTDKGTFIRAQVYEQFKSHIGSAYEQFETDDGAGGTLALEVNDLEVYLLQALREHLGIEMNSTEVDFFAFGIDSLQCIKIWSLLKKELDLGGQQSKLGQNILYETGNVKNLAEHLFALRTGSAMVKDNDEQKMNNLIEKYSDFKVFEPKEEKRPEKDVVLLTGVTGGLGAHVLAQLVARPHVAEVWALVRAPTDKAASIRVSESLKSRGISLSESEQAKIVALSSDLSKSDFGLQSQRLEQLYSVLTLVIHSAWAVNFNIPVQSFEGSHIQATYNLIQLCQSVRQVSPARFCFCSSVSATGGTPKPGVVTEGPVQDISHVQGTGYAKSKYVAEYITINAARKVQAPARVFRVGQLIGDTKAGIWNTTEGIPLMIQTAMTLGALPALDETMIWLPVDNAASIIIELSGSCLDRLDDWCRPDLVYHVLNPHSFHWTQDMLPKLESAFAHCHDRFEVLPKEQWMEKLRSSSQDPAENPPIKLLGWFESKYGHGASKTNRGSLVYETTKTSQNSQALKKIPDVTNQDYVQLLIGALMRKWRTDLGDSSRSG